MRITRKELRRIIREEYGGGDHEYKRDDGHRTGDVGGHYKDYEGHWGGDEGDDSETHPGHKDYEDDHHHKIHQKAKSAVAAIQDLASAAGADIEMEVGDDDLDIDDEEEEEVGSVGLAMENRRRLKARIRQIVLKEMGPDPAVELLWGDLEGALDSIHVIIRQMKELDPRSAKEAADYIAGEVHQWR